MSRMSRPLNSMNRYADCDKTAGQESKMLGKSSSSVVTTTEDGVVAALSVKDLDSAFHSFSVKANFKFSPVKEVQEKIL